MFNDYSGVIVACVIGALILLVLITLIIVAIVVAVRKREKTKYSIEDKTLM